MENLQLAKNEKEISSTKQKKKKTVLPQSVFKVLGFLTASSSIDDAKSLGGVGWGGGLWRGTGVMLSG